MVNIHLIRDIMAITLYMVQTRMRRAGSGSKDTFRRLGALLGVAPKSTAKGGVLGSPPQQPVSHIVRFVVLACILVAFTLGVWFTIRTTHRDTTATTPESPQVDAKLQAVKTQAPPTDPIDTTLPATDQRLRSTKPISLPARRRSKQPARLSRSTSTSSNGHSPKDNHKREQQIQKQRNDGARTVSTLGRAVTQGSPSPSPPSLIESANSLLHKQRHQQQAQQQHQQGQSSPQNSNPSSKQSSGATSLSSMTKLPPPAELNPSLRNPDVAVYVDPTLLTTNPPVIMAPSNATAPSLTLPNGIKVYSVPIVDDIPFRAAITADLPALKNNVEPASSPSRPAYGGGSVITPSKHLPLLSDRPTVFYPNSDVNNLTVVWDFGGCGCTGFMVEGISIILGLAKARIVNKIGVVASQNCFCQGYPNNVLYFLESLRTAPYHLWDIDVFVSHKQPNRYPTWPYRGVINIPFRPKVVVGRSMTEVHKIPQDWADGVNNKADEVWVPSHHSLEAFVDGGAKRDKLHVIHEPVDTDFFDPALYDAHKDPNIRGFNFLSVFKWEQRKGVDVLLHAFFTEFSQDDDVSLTIHTFLFGDPEPRNHWKIREKIQAALDTIPIDNYRPEGPPLAEQVVVISDETPASSMPRIYKAADAFVLPTRGEGWGLPVVEAMAMGLPVICTQWSGPAEFINDEMAYPLKVERLVPAGGGGEFTGDMMWAEPSVDHLRKLMRHVYNNRAEAKKKGKKAYDFVRQHLTQSAIAKEIGDRLAHLMAKHGIVGSAPIADKLARDRQRAVDEKARQILMEREERAKKRKSVREAKRKERELRLREQEMRRIIEREREIWERERDDPFKVSGSLTDQMVQINMDIQQAKTERELAERALHNTDQVKGKYTNRITPKSTRKYENSDQGYRGPDAALARATAAAAAVINRASFSVDAQQQQDQQQHQQEQQLQQHQQVQQDQQLQLPQSRVAQIQSQVPPAPVDPTLQHQQQLARILSSNPDELDERSKAIRLRELKRGRGAAFVDAEMKVKRIMEQGGSVPHPRPELLSSRGNIQGISSAGNAGRQQSVDAGAGSRSISSGGGNIPSDDELFDLKDIDRLFDRYGSPEDKMVASGGSDRRGGIRSIGMTNKIKTERRRGNGVRGEGKIGGRRRRSIKAMKIRGGSVEGEKKESDSEKEGRRGANQALRKRWGEKRKQKQAMDTKGEEDDKHRSRRRSKYEI